MWRRGDERRAEGADAREADAAATCELIERALDHVPIGVIVEDITGAVVIANTRATAPLGDLTGDTLAEIAVRRALERARAGESVVENVDIAGTPPRRVEVTANPIDGGAVATVADTSQRLHLDAVRRDFVANVNHELRTPIGALSILAEALAGEREPATVDRLAHRIQVEATRARSLIDDLLDFARVEAEGQPDHQPVAVAEVVEVAIARVSAAAAQREVQLQVEAATTAIVEGDHEQLIVAVANLVDNAIKYSDNGTVVRILVRMSPEGRGVEIIVSDEGIGIPARDLDRIFERFYRVDQARDRRTGGTGLGLAIVRHVAANHGGVVTVQSEEGVGSTFTLRLPTEGHP